MSITKQLWGDTIDSADSLSRIKRFNLSRGAPLQQSVITEFSELNQVLQKMADKMQHDYPT